MSSSFRRIIRAARTLPRGKRERNPEETKRRILEAAEEEFARKGYDGSRLRDVALAAQVNHALLHHYFGDKEGLFRAVIEKAIGGISSRAYELLRSTVDTRVLVQGYVETIVDYYAHNRNLVQILHFAMLDEGSPAFTLCEEVARSMLLPVLEATAQMAKRAQDDGHLRSDIDPRRLVAVALGAAVHLFHEHHLFRLFLGDDVRSDKTVSEHKRAAVQVLTNGLFRVPGT